MIIIEGTPESIFRRVVTHFAEQRRQSTQEGICAYRSKVGDKCAIGCLIPDNQYERFLEIKNLDMLIRYGCVTLNGDIFDILKRLQIAHDTSMNLGELRSNLKDIAEQFAIEESSIIYSIPAWYVPGCE